MQEADLIAKTLRSVLQSHKGGVPFSRLQDEYKSLTGVRIPFKQLGYSTLEDYLKSVPGVVRIEIGNTGEVICHAVVCQETAMIAQLVACQKNSKRKSGKQVNYRMRLKRTALLSSVGKPKDMLRKPGFINFAEESRKPSLPLPRSKGSCTGVKPNMNPALYPLNPRFGMAAPKEVLMQGHTTVMNRPERRLVLPQRFHREIQIHFSKNLPLDLKGEGSHIRESERSYLRPCRGSIRANISQLDERIVQLKRKTENMRLTQQSMHPKPPYPSNSGINEIQGKIKRIINRFSNGICLAKIPQLYKMEYKEDLNTALLPQLVHWPHICVAEKVCTGGHVNVILYPAGKTDQSAKGISSQEEKPQPSVRQTAETKAAALHGDIKQKIAAILLKYSSGLWANALPKVYEETYKTALPRDLLKNLDSLSDICTVDYISDNPQKAILYAKSKEHIDENLNFTSKISVQEDLQQPTEQESVVTIQESQEVYSEDTTVPPLIIPTEVSPSVVVVERSSENQLVIRYVGKDYSAAQELMESEMKDWYHQNPPAMQIQSPRVGQVVAVLEKDTWVRAQVISAEGNTIKVYYVDYGFCEIIENTRVYKLAKHFYSLPFQASKCRLAGLEAFYDDSALVTMVESLTYGKIFAVEILEKSDIPLVILYDTSGDDDININAVCLKALCDKSLEVHLQAGVLYTNVRVTNVCSDGTLYCQVPSKGLTKLSEVLQKLENYFCHKPATECSVSLPHCGKICLLNYKGKWSRVEITSVHSSRVLDVQFMDTGTVASVKVVELREIPPTYLRDIVAIPAQAIKCCLADLPLNIGMWTPDAVLWLRDTVLNCPDCSIKIVKLDDRIAHIYLFTPKNFPDPDRSINRQITNADLWKHQKDVFLSATPSNFNGKEETDLQEKTNAGARKDPPSSIEPSLELSSAAVSLAMPPLLKLAQPQEQMDIFVSLACHPGYFVLQLWQEMHNLELLVEEMLLYYSAADDRTITVEKNKIYVAKVENRWHRVLIKGMLANGLVSVYELDYGKHELISIQNVRPLVDMFKKLPFQAITAQLAGVESQQWSEEASVVFRNHVEKKPLVAQVEAIIDGANSWDRKVVVYLVDTSLPDTDIWIHDIMTQYCMDISEVN